MRLRVFHKVLLATSLSSLLLIGLVMVFFFDSVTRGFAVYANTIELSRIEDNIVLLEAAYAAHGSWDFLRGNHKEWRRLTRQTDGWDRKRGGREAPHKRDVDHSFKVQPQPQPQPQQESAEGLLSGFGRALVALQHGVTAAGGQQAYSLLLPTGQQRWAQQCAADTDGAEGRPPPPPRGYGEFDRRRPPPGRNGKADPDRQHWGPGSGRPPPPPPHWHREGGPGREHVGPGRDWPPPPPPPRYQRSDGGQDVEVGSAGEPARQAPAPPLEVDYDATRRGLPLPDHDASDGGQGLNVGVIGDVAEQPPAPPAAGKNKRHTPPPHRRGPPPGDALDIGPRITLYDLDQQVVMGRGNYADELAFTPVRGQQEQAVGWVAISPTRAPLGSLDAVFLEDIRHSLLKTGVVALLLSLLVAGLLTRHILAPVRTLATAVRALASGNFRGHPGSKQRDELGQLSRDFNLLARTLAANEQSRNRWVADISHELRTPLASLRAEIEALQDGVMTLDADALASLHGEVMHLGRLVDDLHQLATADAGELQYHREMIDPAELLEQAAAAVAHHYHHSDLALSIECEGLDGARVFGDSTRLVQLFQNLLENSRRYTDPGGRVQVRCQRRGDLITLCIEDTAPGIPAGEHDRVFERLYRVDKSRARARGGSGLGLAICRQIVEAHQGQITAEPSPLGGVAMFVILPLVHS